jgi:hypothetical protein
MPDQKRNEYLEKIRAIAKQDKATMDRIEKRVRRSTCILMLKNRIHYKWLRVKRLIGLRK